MLKFHKPIKKCSKFYSKKYVISDTLSHQNVIVETFFFSTYRRNAGKSKEHKVLENDNNSLTCHTKVKIFFTTCILKNEIVLCEKNNLASDEVFPRNIFPLTMFMTSSSLFPVFVHWPCKVYPDCRFFICFPKKGFQFPFLSLLKNYAWLML